eukprot:1856312-Amphidinium_carterae.1
MLFDFAALSADQEEKVPKSDVEDSTNRDDGEQSTGDLGDDVLSTPAQVGPHTDVSPGHREEVKAQRRVQRRTPPRRGTKGSRSWETQAAKVKVPIGATVESERSPKHT